MFIQPSKSKRLLSDIIGQLEDDLEADPLDYLKWIKFTNQVILKDKEDQVRLAYSNYFKLFDFDAAQWCNLINYELNRGEFQRVETLFQDCFAVTESVALCRLYVSYVRRVNDVITGGESARGIVVQAFEFAIGKVGIDIHSGELWHDYLEFLKTWTPVASWEQQQKVDLIRKVYKRYLAIPTETIVTAWQKYAQWENEVNVATSSKFIAEKSADFMLARSWNTEWHNVTENRLLRKISVKDAAKDQLELWINWIELEKKNTMDSKDANLLEKRILYAYRQATWSLPFISELWFKFAKYWLVTNEEANTSKCIELLKKGLTLNRNSFLLSFQIAELFEKDGSFELAKDTYMRLIGRIYSEHVACTADLEQVQKRLQAKPEIHDENEIEHERLDSSSVNQNKVSREDIIAARKLGTQLATLNESTTLVWTKLMVATRRSSDIKEARQVFKQGRKAFPDIGYAFYVENALLEHHADNQKIALRIFDLAFKARDFALDGLFLLAYFDYLVNSNQVDSIRKLVQTADTSFAKVIGTLQEKLDSADVDENIKQEITAEISRHKNSLRKLFKAYIAYASTFLSLDIAHSFATKYEQLFPQDDPVILFTDRCRIGKRNIIRNLECHFQEEEETLGDEAAPKLKRRKFNPIPNGFAVPADFPLSVQMSSSLQLDSNVSQMMPNALAEPTEPSSKIGPFITALMNELPNALYFGQVSDGVFNPEKLVQLFANLPNVLTL